MSFPVTLRRAMETSEAAATAASCATAIRQRRTRSQTTVVAATAAIAARGDAMMPISRRLPAAQIPHARFPEAPILDHSQKNPAARRRGDQVALVVDDRHAPKGEAVEKEVRGDRDPDDGGQQPEEGDR